MLRLDELAYALGDFLIEPLLAAQKLAGDGAELAVADRVRHIGDDRHGLVLRRSYLLDEISLGYPRRLELGEPVIEAIVLAQDLRDRHLVLGKQRQIRKVHLPRQRLFALLGPADLLVRLIEQLRLLRRVHDRLKTYRRHRDEKQRDDQECGQQLGVDGGTNSSDPTHQFAERGMALDKRSELFEFDFSSLRRRPIFE